eukprot:TRINITY_DN72650_c0_g1_i3.p1 TRINITY_DN72650_c0_g1~~TRINITY_DN72650_c0_g1_i3.p1  ORF type:complete len:190 (+),score=14.54 TRINITY_DN72650_c0_g1_i3:483-1052(+)
MMSCKNYSEAMRKDLLSHWEPVQRFRKPLIAAVNGVALGGGCEIAMMCDIILAAEHAMFGQPEVKLGTVPAMGATQRLTRAVGKSKAMEWILSGRFFTAVEAERAGLVSRVVPSENLLGEAKAVASEIATMPHIAILAAKETVNRAMEVSLAEGILFERRAFQATWATNDRREGMQAFIEKRDPIFTHE